MDKLARKIVQHLQWGAMCLRPSIVRQLCNMRETVLSQRQMDTSKTGGDCAEFGKTLSQCPTDQPTIRARKMPRDKKMIQASLFPALLIALSYALLPAGPAAAQSSQTRDHSFSGAENWSQVFDGHF